MYLKKIYINFECSKMENSISNQYVCIFRTNIVLLLVCFAHQTLIPLVPLSLSKIVKHLFINKLAICIECRLPLIDC